MTMTGQPNREKEIFEQALEIGSGSARESFLNASCSGDPELYTRVRLLLRSHESSAFLPDEPTGVRERMPWSVEEVGNIVGRYKLTRLIGEGGCGVVYFAEQVQPIRRNVALKLIKPGMDTKAVLARFDAERQALAMMDHPHIAKVLDAGATESGRPFFVMELVNGLPITDFCDKHQLPIRKRLELFVDVCQAVQHAHQKGVLHRDLKPSNILVADENERPVPKVIDFGIAKALEGRLSAFTVQTEIRHFLGTPTYTSPEQSQAGACDVDTRADIYSLGTVLFELLTGTTPFDSETLGTSDFEQLRRILRDVEAKAPSERFAQLTPETKSIAAKHRGTHPADLQHQVRGDLDCIILKCLEKDRSRRYDTVNALAMDVRRHLNEEPVLATPPSKVYRLQKFIRRNRAAVFLSTCAFLLLIIAAVGTSIGFLRAEKNARQLQRNLYVSRIALAHRELTGDPPNIGEAEKLLDACPKSLRGWEWHYLKRQWLEEPKVISDPASRGLSSVALAENGRLIATAGDDGYVRIWDSDKNLLKSIPAHTNGFAVSVAFDPNNRDRLVSAGSDELIKLWDWRNKKVVHTWPLHFSFEQGLAYSVAFSPDGKRIAGSSAFNVVTIWDVESGKELRTFSGHEAAAFSLAFSPDGRDLAVGCSDGLVRIWGTLGAQNAERTLGLKGYPVACVAYAKAGDRIAAASFDGRVRVWETFSGEEQLNFQAHKTYAVGVAFIPDGKRLATAGHDRLIKLWDAQSGQETLTIRDFVKEARCVQITSEGRSLIGAGLDGTVRIWDGAPLVGTEGQGVRTISVPTSALQVLEVGRDGFAVLAGGGPKLSAAKASVPLYQWNIDSGKQTEIATDYSGLLFSLALSPDGRTLATTGDDTGVDQTFRASVWNLERRKLALVTEGVPGKGVLFCLSFSPDGKYIVAAGHQGKLITWDADTGKFVGISGEHQRGRTIFYLAFSANGKYLASASQDGDVRIWDAALLGQLRQPITEFRAATPDYTDSVALNRDGSHIVTAQDDNAAVVRDLPAGHEVVVLRTEKRHGFRSLAYSFDGKLIASGGIDSKVILWDAATGTLIRTFAGHRGDIIRLRFANTPNGLRLISESRDCTIKVWDVAFALTQNH